MNPVISAIVCTYRRARYLGLALDSLLAQSLPVSRYEVLVVDNGACAATCAAADAAAARTGNVRYLAEPVVGLSQARNTGWRAARGRYVAYLDDDAVASPGWLEAAVRCFETVIPRPGCVTGRIEAIWEAPRPRWVDDRLLFAFSITDWSAVPRFLDAEQWLAGCNMAFPREALEEAGGFSTALGRRGASLLSDEEFLLRQQLETRGQRCYYDPSVWVRHHVPAERLAKRWLRRRSFWQGISLARRSMLFEAMGGRRRLRASARLVARMLGNPWIAANMLILSDDPRRFALQCRTWNEIGQLAAYLRGGPRQQEDPLGGKA